MQYINLILGISGVLFGIFFNKKRFDKMKHGDKYAIWARVSMISFGGYLILIQFKPSLYSFKYFTLFAVIYCIINILVHAYME